MKLYLIKQLIVYVLINIKNIPKILNVLKILLKMILKNFDEIIKKFRK